MQDLFAAIALVLVIEGLLWATMPEWMKSAALRVAQIDAGALRVAGLATALVGVAAVWLIRG